MLCAFIRNNSLFFFVCLSRKLQQENADLLLHMPDDDANLTEKERLEKAE